MVDIHSTNFVVGLAIGFVSGSVVTALFSIGVYTYFRHLGMPRTESINREENLVRFLAVLATIVLIVYLVVNGGKDLDAVLTGGLIAIIGAGVVNDKLPIGKGKKR